MKNGIRIRDLRFSFGKENILENISLDISPGRFIGIMGPNGSGKTTLLKNISALLKPTAGVIMLDGTDVHKMGRKQAASRLAVLPQESTIGYDFTVYDVVSMGRYTHLNGFKSWTKKDEDAVCRAMKDTGVWHFRERSFNQLSGGEKQRVVLARALAQECDVLLLDEPVTHLDIRHQIEILNLIRDMCNKAGITVIAVLHDLNLASRYSDFIIMLSRKRIEACGVPGEAITSENIRKIFGVEARICIDKASGKPYIFPEVADKGQMCRDGRKNSSCPVLYGVERTGTARTDSFLLPVWTVFAILFAVLAVAGVVSLGMGAARISARDVFAALTGRIDPVVYPIVVNMRFPRIFIAIITGAALSAVGCTMQSIFKNPLVDSYTLGMSSGAALGAVISIILGINMNVFGMDSTGTFAFLGAVSALAFTYVMSGAAKKAATDSMLLAGVAVSFFISSLITFLLMIHRDKIEHVFFWTMGSLALSTWEKVWVSLPVQAAGMLVLLFYSTELNIIATGEEAAHYMGVEVRRVRRILLFAAAVMVGCAVSTAGTIGFIGLVVPHIIRILCGPDNRSLIPLSAVGGAIVLLVSDTIGRVIIQPVEVPVGVITAILGGPFFVFLLRKNKTAA